MHYAEADNELAHLLIMEELGGADAPADRGVAQGLALLYFWFSVGVYLARFEVSSRVSSRVVSP